MTKQIQTQEMEGRSYLQISSNQLLVSVPSNTLNAIPPWHTVSVILEWNRAANLPLEGKTLRVSFPQEIAESAHYLPILEYLETHPMKRILSRLNASFSIPNDSYSQREAIEDVSLSLISPVFNILIHDHQGLTDPYGIEHSLEVTFLWEEERGIPGNMEATNLPPNIKIFNAEDSLPEGYVECIIDDSMLTEIASKFNIKLDISETIFALNTYYDKNKKLEISVRDSKGMIELSEGEEEIYHPVTVNFKWNPYTETASEIRLDEVEITPNAPLLPGTQLASMRFGELLDITSHYGVNSLSLSMAVNVGGKRKEISREMGLYGSKTVTSWDLFISHTSETKINIAEPLALELQNNGAVVWFDEWEILAGDKITRKIEEGINKSPIAVVLISEDFVNKNMARQELESFQIAGKTIIPVLCGVTIDQFIEEYPLLRNNKVIEFEKVNTCANKIIQSLEKNMSSPSSHLNRQQRRARERQQRKNRRH